MLDDKWSLERLLGIGGMAAVYAARHRNGARAALKVLHSDLSSNDEIRERFQREGYAANCVDHPGAVKVLDDDVITGGADAGVAYLVMELLEGQSLQDRLERGPPVGEREFLAIAESVLDVLEVAHTRGVVHRDLKPENLFLVGVAMSPNVDVGSCAMDARVKVLDFGLARLLHGQAITSHGLALGTPSFMSPEQASGKIDEIDGRTDLFALAATGFRLRTGRRIHDGANPVELVTKMANWAAPRIRTVATDVSAPFARVIDRGLEFRREDRYESAAAMRKDVVGALRELRQRPRRRGAGQAPTVAADDVGRGAHDRSERGGSRIAGEPASRLEWIFLDGAGSPGSWVWSSSACWLRSGGSRARRGWVRAWLRRSRSIPLEAFRAPPRTKSSPQRRTKRPTSMSRRSPRMRLR